MKANVAKKVTPVKTHEGGKGERLHNPAKELERTVATCMLFEDTFYESGYDIAQRIEELSKEVDTPGLIHLAHWAKTDMKLRHVPLFLAIQALKKKIKPAPKEIANLIRRPDEMGEILALYWKDKRKPVAAALKKGIALAYRKFDEYQLAKWNRDAQISLRDVMLIVHPKPEGEAQAGLWKRVLEDKLATPDTWEVAISAAKGQEEKLAAWLRILTEMKKSVLPATKDLPEREVTFPVLGDMAFLMNLRNMVNAGVSHTRIQESLKERSFVKILPWRFISAAKHAPVLAQEISDAMLRSMRTQTQLQGATHIVIDVSGSMDGTISQKSQMSRWEVAAGLAILIREISKDSRFFTFSDRLVELPNYRGLGVIPLVDRSQPHNGTYLDATLNTWKGLIKTQAKPARVIVITDEQAHDGITTLPDGVAGYIVNVAPYNVGVNASGKGWKRINGWSERILDWIRYEEGPPSA